VKDEQTDEAEAEVHLLVLVKDEQTDEAETEAHLLVLVKDEQTDEAEVIPVKILDDSKYKYISHV